MNKKDITAGYACLGCRKVFKKHKYAQDREGNWQSIEYEVVCPQCNSEMYETGTAFKAPKTKDVKAWAKLIPLFESGYRFNPDFGSPFVKKEPEDKKRLDIPQSEFRKPARKRVKSS